VASTIAPEQVTDARKLLSRYLSPTRLQPAVSLSRISGCEVSLKLESELPTGSFKVRGALYALATNLQRCKMSQVVTASTGNHGAAVAYAAALLSVRCTVFLPEDPNPTKRDRIVDLGATVIERGRDLTEAATCAASYSDQQDGYFLNDATDPDLPAGPATMACEILNQWPDTDTVVVPVGDTALIRGIACAVRHLRPEMRIIGVLARNAPAYYHSWNAGHIVKIEQLPTIADGLASQVPLPQNVDAIRGLVDELCLVSDKEMLGAIRQLILKECVLSEPAGAAATAAVMNRRMSKLGKKVVTIVSGANISPQVLTQVATL